MSDLIKIDVGIVGLDTEIDKEIAEIEKDIPKALENVGSEIIESLSRHLDEDFYNKYSPVAYRRRYTEGLRNKKNMIATVKGRTLQFEYKPSGEPTGTLGDTLNWSEDLENWLKRFHKTATTPIFSPAHDGDDLIVWAQKRHEIGKYEIPARPFWNIFVEEQKNDGILNAFSVGMLPNYEIIKEGGEKDLVFDNGESMLEADSVQTKMDI